MNWKPISENPKKQDRYLCCGDEIDQLFEDEPDIYFLADYVYSISLQKWTWIECVPNFTDVKILYWCGLPELPKNK